MTTMLARLILTLRHALNLTESELARHAYESLAPTQFSRYTQQQADRKATRSELPV